MKYVIEKEFLSLNEITALHQSWVLIDGEREFDDTIGLPDSVVRFMDYNPRWIPFAGMICGIHAAFDYDPDEKGCMDATDQPGKLTGG